MQTKTRTRGRQLSLSTAWGIDAVAILLFVLVGRSSHEEGITIGGVVVVAAPFLIALTLAYARPLVRQAPSSLKAGLTVWLTVVAVGMVMRHFVFRDGTATAFVVVTTLFLGVLFNGWRAIARALPAD